MEIADDESFKQLSTLSRVMLYTTTNIGFFLAQKKDTWDKIVDLFDTDNAGNVAHTITFGNDKVMEIWIQSMHPEALGPLLLTLLKDSLSARILIDEKLILFSEEQCLAMQKIALAKIINWIYNYHKIDVNDKLTARRLVQKSLINANGVKHNITPYKKLKFYHKCNDIYSFMEKHHSLSNKNDETSKLLSEQYYITENFNTQFHQLTSPLYGEFSLNHTKVKKEYERYLIGIKLEYLTNYNSIINKGL